MSATAQADHPAGAYTRMERLLGGRQLARDLDLFARTPARARMQGDTRSRFRGRGMEFEEARHYAPGDDVRTIDWRVTARTGIAHTKVFREERERPVHILVDQRSNMFFGSGLLFKSVFAAEVASLIAWAALEGSDRIGGQIVCDDDETDIRARRSRHAVLRFLRELHQANQRLPGAGGGLSMAEMLSECQRLARPGTAVFVISDFIDFDQAARRALSLTGRHADVTLLRILDPLEQQIPAVGRTRITDGDRSLEVSLDSATVAKLNREMQALDDLLASSAKQARASLMTARTSDNPIHFLRRRYAR